MTGGFYRESGVFDGARASTEILSQDASQWTLTGELPYPAKYISGTTLDNRLIMAGMVMNFVCEAYLWIQMLAILKMMT